MGCQSTPEIFTKFQIQIDLLPVYFEVLQILHPLREKFHPWIVVIGNMRRMVLQMAVLAPVEVHKSFPAHTMAMGNCFMETSLRVWVHPGQLQFGLRLEKQRVILSNYIYLTVRKVFLCIEYGLLIFTYVCHPLLGEQQMCIQSQGRKLVILHVFGMLAWNR